MATLVDDLVPDELWMLVAPLLPAPPRPAYGGRHRTIPDRACFAAIVYMARTSTPWRLLPARELGCGSASTAWRRLVDRGKPGAKLHLVCDGQGLPLAAAVTAANLPDVTMLQAMVDDIPPIRTPSGRRRTRPGAVHTAAPATRRRPAGPR
jgi:transposase